MNSQVEDFGFVRHLAHHNEAGHFTLRFGDPTRSSLAAREIVISGTPLGNLRKANLDREDCVYVAPLERTDGHLSRPAAHFPFQFISASQRRT